MEVITEGVRKISKDFYETTFHPADENTPNNSLVQCWYCGNNGILGLSINKKKLLFMSVYQCNDMNCGHRVHRNK